MPGRAGRGGRAPLPCQVPLRLRLGDRAPQPAAARHPSLQRGADGQGGGGVAAARRLLPGDGQGSRRRRLDAEGAARRELDPRRRLVLSSAFPSRDSDRWPAPAARARSTLPGEAKHARGPPGSPPAVACARSTLPGEAKHARGPPGSPPAVACARSTSHGGEITAEWGRAVAGWRRRRFAAPARD